jgi:hypothetical protein
MPCGVSPYPPGWLQPAVPRQRRNRQLPTMIDPHGAHTGQVMVRSEWEAVRERSDEAGLAASATSRDQAD